MSSKHKHFVNNPSLIVREALVGLVAANPHLLLDAPNKVVHLPATDHRVALISGGGSGHEPAHAGFVGQGILSAAVCGDVFASPNTRQIRRAIQLVDNSKGTILIVKNYTGDVLNFSAACSTYVADHPTKATNVKTVIVGDDVSVGRTQGAIVGRRGLAGTVLVYKIAGALAEQGADFDEVYELAQDIASRVGTIGVARGHVQIPGTAPSESSLVGDAIEIGLGIHNEQGARRISPSPPLSTLVSQLLDMLLSTSDPERSFLPFTGENDEVVLMVNNLGSTTELEMNSIVGETNQQLKARGVVVKRVLSGTYMTSLDMPGFSLTLLLLPREQVRSDNLLSLLDAPAFSPGWKWSAARVPSIVDPNTTSLQEEALEFAKPEADAALKPNNPEEFIAAIKRACEALILAEPEITRMDTIAGDGDCGLTLRSLAQGVLKQIENGFITGEDAVSTVVNIAKVAEKEMGGTSGALYSIFFSALGAGLRTSNSKGTELTSATWHLALRSALDRLYASTRARPPSRTLMDPLVAFVEGFAKDGGQLDAAVKTACQAAEETKNLEAKAGRSAYVESERLKQESVPDPGAWGVRVILTALFGEE